MSTILLIEDESSIADTVLYALESEGFHCVWKSLGREGVCYLQEHEDVALIILDVGLPDGNGFEFCKEIRRHSNVPLIFLTARSHEIDRIVGLEIGADDYVSKPFSPRELAARVKVILRRSGQGASVDESEFVIERSKGRIRYRGTLLELTHYEYQILALFLQQPERIFSRGQIMDHVWSEPDTSLERAVDTHIKTLRAKLSAVHGDTDPIHTHRGMGYSLSGSVRES
ncbi:MAG TPA: two-component system response regulator CreB [Gammaproteobacteria bacterium]